MTRRWVWIVGAIWILSGCSEQTNERARKPEMKCGAGKCGANMISGSSGLERKKQNILSQMRADDPRKACVLEAKTTKLLYDCVRDPVSGKLSTKCGVKGTEPAMKCAAGKCGSQP